MSDVDITLKLDLNIDTGTSDGTLYDSYELDTLARRLLFMAMNLGMAIQFEHYGKTIKIRPDDDTMDIRLLFEPNCEED